MASNNVTRLLTARGVPFSTHELPNEKLGALEAAIFLGIPENQMFKTIVLLDENNASSILAMVPGDKSVDIKLVGKLLRSKKVKAASQAQAENLTGLQSGGISPLALIGKRFRVLLDETALFYDFIYISGGQRGLIISLNPKDLILLSSAQSGPIAK